MLEKKITINADRPDRMEITEGSKPWQWGGFELSPSQVLLFLIFPFILAIGGSRRIVVDKVYQGISIATRSLLPRKARNIDFSQVEKITLSHRSFTPATGGNYTFPLDLEEVSLVLTDTTTQKMVTGYRGDAALREAGNKLSELTGKPFEVNTGKKPG